MAQFNTKAGIQISYDNNKEDILSENINALIKSIQAGNFFTGFHVSPSLLLISSLLKIARINDEDAISSFVFAAGVDLQAQDAATFTDFLEAVGIEAKKYLNQPHQEYHVIFPLNYLREKLPEENFTINGNIFEIKSWPEISKTYSITYLQEIIERFIDYNHSHLYWHEHSTPLLLKIYGRSAEEAFRNGEKAYDILIASLNYILDTSITFSTNQINTMASVIPSYGYGVFSQKGDLVMPYFDSVYLNFQPLCKQELDFARLQSVLDILLSKLPLINRFMQALLSYNTGLTSSRWDLAFLSFWRVFEILAFGNRFDYHMDDVVKRICLLINATSKDKEFLKLCANWRNSLVHRGVFSSEEQPYAILMKVFSKICLFKFEILINNFSTEQMLEDYYEMADLNKDRLSEKREVINNILSKK